MSAISTLRPPAKSKVTRLLARAVTARRAAYASLGGRGRNPGRSLPSSMGSAWSRTVRCQGRSFPSVGFSAARPATNPVR